MMFEPDHELLSKTFTEWARRYAESPNDFDLLLTEDGKPITDYGHRCATYFEHIAELMTSLNNVGESI